MIQELYLSHLYIHKMHHVLHLLKVLKQSFLLFYSYIQQIKWGEHMNNQGEKQENAKETSNAVVEKLLNSRSLIISGEINQELAEKVEKTCCFYLIDFSPEFDYFLLPTPFGCICLFLF